MTKAVKNILEIGTVLNNKWVILELIGKGGMGEVYRAHQLNLKRDVAIKILSEELFEELNEDSEEIEIASARFGREVKAMANIRHPNVVQIFDYGSDTVRKDRKDAPIEYIVMEYIPGSTLRFTMSEEGFFPDERLTETWLVEYFLAVLDGVEALHGAGIIHRDLKPENFLLDGHTPKIADFGLARSVKMEPITKSADMKGTPCYMSPEQFLDFRRVDQSSDIYSLGKILFEVIEGKMPPNTIPFKSAKLETPNTPFFQELDRIVQRATAEDKAKRTESVQRLRTELQEAISRLKTENSFEISSSYQPPSPLAHYKWIWVGITVAILSVAGMTVWHLLGDPWNSQKSFQKPKIGQQELTKSIIPDSKEGKSPSSDALPATSIMGEDGKTMRYIPGGFLRIDPSADVEGGHKVQIGPFYIDETKVTIHHFAEFLNDVKDSLTIEDGLVKHDGKIWCLLGEDTEKYNQIIYQHGRYHLKDPKNAGGPVVRVTWYGASAYARHFGKRLPTDLEWEFAVQQGRILEHIALEKKVNDPKSGGDDTSSTSKGSSHMMDMGSAVHPYHTGENPVSEDRPMTDEIISTKDIEKNIKEWVVRVKNGQTSGQHPSNIQSKIRYSSLVMGISLRTKDSAPQGTMRSFRYPWEAFFDVGFRCVKSIPEKPNKS